MKYKDCKLSTYDIELMAGIESLKDVPNIWSYHNNKLDCLWVSNYKDKIKVQTSMKIPFDYYGEEYTGNFYFDITLTQAEEIIKELQKALKRRKKK